MAQFEHRPGQFSLFKNNKDGNEKRPDYTGEGKDLDGNAIRVSAWLKKGQSSGTFMSCNFELKRDQAPNQEKKPAAASGFEDMEDDLPF